MGRLHTIETVLIAFLWAFACVAAGYILLLIVSALLVDPRKTYPRESRYYRFLLNSSTAIGLWIMRLRIRVKGKEKLPEGRFLIVGNHRSNLDPIVTWHAFPDRQLAFISKPQNFKIPVWGRLIRRCAFLPIDRDDPRSGLKTIQEAAGLICRDAASVGVYPEGKRSKSVEMLPFKNGVFKLAQKADCPIVILLAEGTEAVCHRYPWRRTRICLTVTDVLPREAVQSMKTNEIGEAVRQSLIANMTKEEGKQNVSDSL